MNKNEIVINKSTLEQVALALALVAAALWLLYAYSDDEVLENPTASEVQSAPASDSSSAEQEASAVPSDLGFAGHRDSRFAETTKYRIVTPVAGGSILRSFEYYSTNGRHCIIILYESENVQMDCTK